MQVTISHWLHIDKQTIIKDGSPLLSFNTLVNHYSPEDVYKTLQVNYVKFYKMDLLSKWAWVGAEILLRNSTGYVYEGFDKTKIGLVLMTTDGCLDVDKKYLETTKTIPSPALFVYTLPNIMLGEISIRHGIKGEQICLIDESFNTQELSFCVNDLMLNRGMDACICGYVNATSESYSVKLCWATKAGNGKTFNESTLKELFG